MPLLKRVDDLRGREVAGGHAHIYQANRSLVRKVTRTQSRVPGERSKDSYGMSHLVRGHEIHETVISWPGTWPETRVLVETLLHAFWGPGPTPTPAVRHVLPTLQEGDPPRWVSGWDSHRLDLVAVAPSPGPWMAHGLAVQSRGGRVSARYRVCGVVREVTVAETRLALANADTPRRLWEVAHHLSGVISAMCRGRRLPTDRPLMSLRLLIGEMYLKDVALGARLEVWMTFCLAMPDTVMMLRGLTLLRDVDAERVNNFWQWSSDWADEHLERYI